MSHFANTSDTMLEYRICSHLTEITPLSAFDKLFLSQRQIDQALSLLAHPRPSLKFPEELECQFLRYMLSSYKKENKIFPLAGIFGLLLFFISDLLVIPSLAAESALIRFGCALLILILLYISAKTRTVRRQFYLLAYGVLIIHVSLLFVGVLASKLGNEHYQFGSIITIFFLCNVLRINFRIVLPFALIMLGLSLITFIGFGFSKNQLIESSFIYVFITLISLLSNATMDKEVRLSFLQQVALRQERLALLETQKELQKISEIDGLTEIYNRRYFNTALPKLVSSAQRHQQPISILMIDVDAFKAFNDNQGHLEGDKALKLIAQTIKSCLHRPDDLCARYGGEEFVAVLPFSNARAAQFVSEQIISTIEATRTAHAHNPASPWVTVSIGYCSMIPESYISPEYLLKCADDALYQAKHKGRNRAYASEKNT